MIGWARTALGTEVRDHYGQTEHGMFINNHWADELRAPLIPGSMGWPMPGFATGIVREQIAIDVPASPAFWFPGYLDAPEEDRRPLHRRRTLVPDRRHRPRRRGRQLLLLRPR